MHTNKAAKTMLAEFIWYLSKRSKERDLALILERYTL